MDNTQILIITLILLGLWIYWQQNNQPTLAQPSNQELQDLQNQVVHYQTLYQKRVEKDLVGNQEVKINQLENEVSDLSKSQEDLKNTLSAKQTELSEREKLIGEYKGLEVNLRNRVSDYEKEKKDWTEANQLLTANLNQALEKQEVYQQKAGDLETQLLNLAKQKIKGKKEAEKLMKKMEDNLISQLRLVTNEKGEETEKWKSKEGELNKRILELEQNRQENLNQFSGKIDNFLENI